MRLRQFTRDLAWILPVSAGLGLGLALLSGGSWWMGWLAYSIIWAAGLAGLAALWRSAGSGKTLGWMLLLAVTLRLGLGMTFSVVLPAYGNDTSVQNSGYIFSDAYKRDTQAWELAGSKASLLKAFDKTFTSDQYGGMLFVSSGLYRGISRDAHRSWLIILAGALSAAIGVALAYRAGQKMGGEASAKIIGWTMALFPEAILLGSSQMREPFLMTFIAMGLWGVVNWSKSLRWSIAWMAGGFVGLLLFNPGVAVAGLVVLAVWFWLSRKERRIPIWAWAIGAGLAALAGLVFTLALVSSTPTGSGPFANLLNWFRYSIHYDATLSEASSGWVQNVLSALPDVLHLPFIVAYGVLQPVLPAAVADPAVWPMRVLGILRGAGWYALLPFLLYSLRSILKIGERRERLAWLWLWIANWGWILLASLRAGGDQWDNPRYRAIFLIFQAALAAQAFVWQRATRDRWLGRFLAVEGVFLILFGYWYAARYMHWQGGQVHIFLIIGLIVLLSGIIVIWGWWRDRLRRSLK